MRQNETAFRWSRKSEQAAALVAEDRDSDHEIAAACGIARATLARWKRHPAFAARVAQIVADLRAAVLARGIADRQNRVDALNDRWRRMQTLLAARAVLYQGFPGGETGLLVRQVKLVKVYDVADTGDAVVATGTADEAIAALDAEPADDGLEILVSARRQVEVEEYVLDAALLRELREHEKQAAQELGQWTERHDHSGSVLIREYGGFDPDEV